MKKSILQFSVIAAIAATMTLTTSCSSDDGIAAYVPEPVQFNVGLGNLSVSRGTTRAQASNTKTDWNSSIDGKFAVNDKIFIYTTDADGKWYKKQYNVTAAAASAGAANTITPTDDTPTGKFYWKSSTERKQYEIYSFGKNVTETATAAGSGDASQSLTIFSEYTVTGDQTDAATKEEFLYGYGTVYHSTDAKTLKLAHQLARIDIVITTPKNTVAVDKNDDGDTLDDGEAAQTAADMTVTIGTASTKRSGTFTKPSFTPITASADESTVLGGGTPADQIEEGVGTWAPTVTATGAYTPRVLQAQTYDDGTKKCTTKYSAVVMPDAFPSGQAMFTIGYDGATYAYKPASNETIAAGYHYTYTVTIQEEVLNVTNVTISNWTTSSQNATAVLQ